MAGEGRAALTAISRKKLIPVGRGPRAARPGTDRHSPSLPAEGSPSRPWGGKENTDMQPRPLSVRRLRPARVSWLGGLPLLAGLLALSAAPACADVTVDGTATSIT
jgi:hypothetical protein